MPVGLSARPEAVLLDRDGTINVKAAEGDYVRSADDLHLLPGAAAAIARLNAAAVPVFVVTNQRGISRGLMTLRDLAAVHERLETLLGLEGAHVDGIYSCPHATGDCDCRKPLPGLALAAQAEHPGWELTRSVVVGDAASDMGLARAIGARAIRLLPVGVDNGADATVPTLEAAVALILGPV